MSLLRLKDFTVFQQAVVALALILALLIGFFFLDPYVFRLTQALPPEVRKFFHAITDVGKSNWMLIPTGTAVALALVLRKRYGGLKDKAAYGLIASTIGYVFVSIGGAGLIANLTKDILGRARPTLFDSVGPVDFHLFAFSPDYASFPSGHATNIFAFATVLGILLPRTRVPLYALAVLIAASRVLIGQHYVTDVLLGAMLGIVFPYYVRDRFAARRWLFERSPHGGYRIRGEKTQRWLGWPRLGQRATNQPV